MAAAMCVLVAWLSTRQNRAVPSIWCLRFILILFRLDSVADFGFFGVLMLKALPVVYSEMPEGIWYTVCAVLVVRIAAYIVGALRYRRFAALHTWLNKLTGGAIFLLPYALVFSYGTGYLRIVCALALLAAAEELAMNIRFKEYRADRKSIFLTGEKNENT